MGTDRYPFNFLSLYIRYTVSHEIVRLVSIDVKITSKKNIKIVVNV